MTTCQKYDFSIVRWPSNSRSFRNDYEITYLHRLQDREKMLNEKRREMNEILETHQYLQAQVDARRHNEQKFRSTLANEYKQVMEEKKRRVE